jgi:hypothetical protein
MILGLIFTSNLLVKTLILVLLIALFTIFVYGSIVVFIFKICSIYLVSKYNNLKSFKPLFLKISIATICIHFILCYTYMFELYIFKIYMLKHCYIDLTAAKVIEWFFIIASFICIIAGNILTSATNKINIGEENDIRKKMNIYCWCLNIAIMIFTIMPCTFHIYLYGLSSIFLMNIFSIIFLLTHIELFVRGRFNISFFEF